MGFQNWVWDEENRRYVPEETLRDAPNYDVDLMAVGTRYDHWMELLEEFRSGIVALDTVREQYRSKADDVRRQHLNSAIDLIEKQLERHSNYDRKIWDTGRIIDAIPKKPEQVK